jgi:uncharacterized protein involved in outer membrane biogenesis/outer membrane protein OmpA-like peptidoglycan-associated protein
LLHLPASAFEFSTLGLLRSKLTVHSVSLSRPELFLKRSGATRFNVTEVLQLPQEEPEREDGGPTLDFTIEQFTIQDGRIIFSDLSVSPQFEQVLKNVTLRAGRISSLPTLVTTPTSFEFRVDIDDGSITLSGEATPIARPAGVEVTARWKQIDPDMLEAYLPNRPIIDLSESRSSGEARYVLIHEQNKTNYLTASFTTGPVKLYSPGAQEPVVSVSGLSVQDMHWDLLRDQGRMEELIVQQPHFLLERDQQGVFTMTRLFAGSDGDNAGNSESQGASDSGMPFAIDYIRTERGTIEFLDHKVKPNVKAVFENVRLDFKDLNLHSDAKPGRLIAEARLGKSPVLIDGSLQAHPFTTRLQVSTKSLPLKPYEGYLRSAWEALDEWGGDLDGQVQLSLATHQDALRLELSGNLEARKFSLGLSGDRRPPLQAQKLKVKLNRLSTYPSFFVDIDQLQLFGADFHVRRNSDGNFNLSPLWDNASKENGSSPEPEGQDSAASEPPFVIRDFSAKESSIEFADATVKPEFETTLTDLSLEMGKLGRRSGFTPVAITATVEERARLELTGSIKPFETPAQIKLDGILRDFDLSQLNPYATKFIRYEISRGRVTTDVEYTYDAGDLAGENEIAIRNLQLGERFGDEFEDRVGVSLRLAIALLQEADGTIRLAIPVSGNLNDPQFDFGSIIWRAVRNAVIRFLSAPLRLLGNIVTLGGRITQIRVDPVEFELGSTDLTPKGEQQLEQLAQLLTDRPKLELELRGIASPKELDDLKRHTLRQKIKDSGEAYDSAIIRLYGLATKRRAESGTPSLREMEDYLADQFVLSQDALHDLARERASHVEDQLAALGVHRGRLYVDSAVDDDASGRVEFELLG